LGKDLHSVISGIDFVPKQEGEEYGMEGAAFGPSPVTNALHPTDAEAAGYTLNPC
jgi:hypothetical protein